jgi:hypothetical protein
MTQCDVLRDHAPHRHAGHVDAVPAQMLGKTHRIRRHLGHAGRSVSQWSAPANPPVVEPYDPVVSCKLLRDRAPGQATGAHAHDQKYRWTLVSQDLVVYFCSIDGRYGHGISTAVTQEIYTLHC